MIYLVTGRPGSGKTVYILRVIDQLVKEGRKVYVLNIHLTPDFVAKYGEKVIVLDHLVKFLFSNKRLPLRKEAKFDEKGNEIESEINEFPSELPDYVLHEYRRIANFLQKNKAKIQEESGLKNDMLLRQNLAFPVGEDPDSMDHHRVCGILTNGSVLIIDEAQEFFPRFSRGTYENPCLFVQYFQVHRHQKTDIYMLSQDPMLMDKDARERFTERHVHLTNFAGFPISIIREYVSYTPVDEMKMRNKLSVEWMFLFQKKYKEVFQLYCSTNDGEPEKRKGKLPPQAWVFIIGLLFVPFGIWLAQNTYNKVANFSLEAKTAKTNDNDIEVGSLEKDKETYFGQSLSRDLELESVLYRYELIGKTVIGKYKSVVIQRTDLNSCLEREKVLNQGDVWENIRIELIGKRILIATIEGKREIFRGIDNKLCVKRKKKNKIHSFL